MNFVKGFIVGITVSSIILTVYITRANPRQVYHAQLKLSESVLSGARIIPGDPDKNDFFIVANNEPDPHSAVNIKTLADRKAKATYVASEIMARLADKKPYHFTFKNICLNAMKKSSQVKKPKSIFHAIAMKEKDAHPVSHAKGTQQIRPSKLAERIRTASRFAHAQTNKPLKVIAKNVHKSKQSNHKHLALNRVERLFQNEQAI